MRSLPIKRGIFFGFAIFLVTTVISWITVHKVVSGPFLIIGSTLACVFFFLPYAIDRVARSEASRSFLTTLYLPIAWVSLETLFSILIADQGSIAYSQFENLPLLQLASVLGMAGVTFVIAWTASVVSWTYENICRQQKYRAGLSIFLTIVGTILATGYARISATESVVSTVRVGAITLNSNHPMELVRTLRQNPGDFHAAKHLEEQQHKVFDLTNIAAAQGAKIILWSEVLGANIGPDSSLFTASIQNLAQSSKVFLLAAVGLNTFDNPLTDNKVILFGQNGDALYSYRKSNLSPGEPSIPGEKKLRFADTPYGRIGTAICADFSFSHFIRKAGANHVDLMLDPAAEWTELKRIQTAVPIFRAVENGFNIVKATSNGVSLIADYRGRILESSDENSDTPLIGEVPTKGVETIFSQGGWTFSWIVLALFVSLLFVKAPAWWRQK